MKKLKLILPILLLSILLTSCTKDLSDDNLEVIVRVETIQDEELISQENFSQLNSEVQSTIQLPLCLEKTVVDSFLYFTNEFNNYFLSESNMNNWIDSLEFNSLINSLNLATQEDSSNFISSTWNIPNTVVNNYMEFSIKMIEELEKEDVRNHPIASRYYQLIKSECLISVLPNEIFENPELIISLFRKNCDGGELLSSCLWAAFVCAGACVAPSPWSVIGAGKALWDFGSNLNDCA